MPKVSVLMPAYNAALYIGEAIQSILDQSFTDFEFIIIDDCSSDSTWEIIQRYASLDSRIVAVRNDENLNIAANRNKLLGLATGEYIAWQDADDISICDRLKKQVMHLDINSRVGIVGGIVQFFDDDSNTRFRSYHLDDQILRNLIFQQSPLSQGAAMIRKSVIDEVGGFDTTLLQAEDLDLSFRVGEKWEFSNLQDVMIKCRFHLKSISTSNLTGNIKDTLVVRKRYMHSKKYNFTLKDRAAYIITSFIKFMPARIVIKIFEILRS